MAMIQNVQAKREGNKLILTIDVSEQTIKNAPRSSTGKSKLIASSGGFQSVDGNGLGYSLNVNYRG